MKKTFEFILRLAGLSVYFLSYLIPRKRTLWIFGEAYGYNNNSKYLFLECLHRHPEIDAVWMASSKQLTAELASKRLPAVYRRSLKGYGYALRAKCYIVSSTPGDISFYLSGGAFVVNLWHGIALKKCLWENPFHKKRRQQGWLQRFVHCIFYPHLYFTPRIVLSTSPDMTETSFKKMFGVENRNIIEAIYPRCSFMLQDHDKLLQYIKTYENEEILRFIQNLDKYRKVILYAPTFRDSGEDFIAASGIDFDDLNRFCMKREFYFIVKAHPATHFGADNKKLYSNLVFLDKRYDPYLLMPFVDTLVSDYSSIAWDFMLLKKPIVMFPFDLEHYCAKCRELVMPYDEAIKGIPIVRTYKDLLCQLEISDRIETPETLVTHYWNGKTDIITTIQEKLGCPKGIS